jgi:hypothetical protein
MSADIHRNTTLGGAPSQIERDSIVYNRYSRESRQFCITPITHRVIDSIATHKLLSKVKKLEVAKLLSKVKKLDPPPPSHDTGRCSVVRKLTLSIHYGPAPN